MDYKRKPEWLKVKLDYDKNALEVKKIIKKHKLNTVCTEAACPNRCECFKRKTATFMILGSVCTRNCTFCNVNKGETEKINEEESRNVAKAIEELNLKHVVITSVTRDDLSDGGATHFANVIKEIKMVNNDIIIEVLIPDFQGDENALKIVINAKPNIINHNIETVPRLYPEVRPKADYFKSLQLLERVKKNDSNMITKSGIMLGLGESEEEVIEVLKDLVNYKCDILTVGQYLAPTKKHHTVIEYIHPDKFEALKIQALKLGFKYVSSGPLIRSSYLADEAMKFIMEK